MTYNPYINLAALAAMNVLKDEDPDSDLYEVLEVCVHIGAAQASMWLVAGKPCTKEELVDAIMEVVEPQVRNASYPQALVGQVLPTGRIRNLVERGFEWLLRFDLNADSISLNKERS